MPIMFPRKILQRNLSPTDTPADNEVLTFDAATNLWEAEAGGGGGGAFATKFKTVDQTVNNSTTLVDIADLNIALAANKEYIIFYWVRSQSTATADIKFAWTTPANGNTELFTTQAFSSVISSFTENLSVGKSNSSFGQLRVTPFWIYVETTEAGDFQPQFAQLVLQVADTKVFKGSFVQAWEAP